MLFSGLAAFAVALWVSRSRRHGPAWRARLPPSRRRRLGRSLALQTELPGAFCGVDAAPFASDRVIVPPACRRSLIPPARRMPMSRRPAAPLGCADFRHSLATDRRSFLKAGVLGAAGLSLAELLRPEAKAESSTSRKTFGHHPVDARRAEPHRHVGPQARRPGRVSRRVRRHADATCPASGSPTCCRCAARSWTSGRSSAACTTTTPATPPATRSASPATRPARTPTRTSTPAAARSCRSSSAT